MVGGDGTEEKGQGEIVKGSGGAAKEFALSAVDTENHWQFLSMGISVRFVF